MRSHNIYTAKTKKGFGSFFQKFFIDVFYYLINIIKKRKALIHKYEKGLVLLCRQEQRKNSLNDFNDDKSTGTEK